MSKENKQINLDGWGDILGGLGSENSDRNVFYKPPYQLTPLQLQDIFVNDGLGNIACTEIPGDGIKNGFTIYNDENDFIKNKLKSLNFGNVSFDAWSSARGLGGSLLVAEIDDGGQLFEPVNFENIKDITELTLYDRTDIQITVENFETDIESDNYGSIKYYFVTMQNGEQVKIHYSRCFWFSGEYLPRQLKEQNDFFDGSVIQRVYNSLSKIGPAFEYVNKLLKRFNVLKFGINGLSDIVKNGKTSEIKGRLSILKTSMDIFNAAMYDADGETITSETITLSGIPDVLKLFMIQYSAETRIPVNRLFSKLFGGIGTEGDGDESRYFDYVKREQERVWFSVIQDLIYLVSNINGSGLNAEEVYFEFNPLQIDNANEISEIDSRTVENLVKLTEWNLITTEQAENVLSNLKSMDINFEEK